MLRGTDKNTSFYSPFVIVGCLPASNVHLSTIASNDSSKTADGISPNFIKLFLGLVVVQRVKRASSASVGTPQCC